MNDAPFCRFCGSQLEFHFDRFVNDLVLYCEYCEDEDDDQDNEKDVNGF